MKKVYKYSILFTIDRDVTIALPKGAKILKVQKQYTDMGGMLFIWCLVDPDEEVYVERKLLIAATGGTDLITHQDGVLVAVWEHIDTLFDGGYVWHVFENVKN